jgi:hypothetical protein
MIKRRLIAVLAALAIALGVAGSPQAIDEELQGSASIANCGRECTWD